MRPARSRYYIGAWSSATVGTPECSYQQDGVRRMLRSVWRRGAPDARRMRYPLVGRSLHAMDPDAQLPWYHRPGWVLVLLFVILGPLALPYLWKSPRFSRGMKIALTVAEIVYTVMLLETVAETVRVVQEQLVDPLGN